MKNIHFTSPMDVFIVSIKTSFLTSIIFTSPIWLYQFWTFLEPALYKKEKRLLKPFAVSSIILFLLGTAFCFYVVLPSALDFLLKIGTEVGSPMITITDYMSLFTVFILGFGFIFETPVILIMLSLLGIISAKDLSSQRRFVFVAILIVAALLTPPDPFSQVAMAIPLYIMFELSIFLIHLIARKKGEKL